MYTRLARVARLRLRGRPPFARASFAGAFVRRALGRLRPNVPKPAENRARAFAAVGMRPFFNYALKRVIKCSYTKNTWRPFDVPAIELRRILGEMAAAGKAATLTYKDGDRTIQVGYDADGAQVKCTGCTPDDVASQGPLPFWAEKFLVYLPYPVLADGNGEMPCAGP